MQDPADIVDWENIGTTNVNILRLSTSALAGDPDPNPQVFSFLIAILGSAPVSATGWLGSVSQVPINSQVPMGPQCTWKYLQVLIVLNINKIDSIKFIVNTNIHGTE